MPSKESKPPSRVSTLNKYHSHKRYRLRIEFLLRRSEFIESTTYNRVGDLFSLLGSRRSFTHREQTAKHWSDPNC